MARLDKASPDTLSLDLANPLPEPGTARWSALVTASKVPAIVGAGRDKPKPPTTTITFLLHPTTFVKAVLKP